MITAKDIMHKDLTAVLEDDFIEDAVHIIAVHKLPGVPVVKENWELVGFLSERDVLKAALPTYLEVLAQSTFLDEEEEALLSRLKSLGQKLVKDVMVKDVIYVDEDASLLTVADLMIRGKVKRLPVVKDKKLVGIIDRGTFCEFMLEGYYGKE